MDWFRLVGDMKELLKLLEVEVGVTFRLDPEMFIF